MKNLLFILLSILLFACSGQSQWKLPAKEFNEKLKAMPDAPLIDVRTREEYNKGHLAKSLNYDWYGNNFNEQVGVLDKSKPVFVYCLKGQRSADAAAMMRKNGFKEVYEMEGGILKWREANLPEVSDQLPIGMTMDQFNELLNTDKLVLVDYYADWCGPCRKMKPYLEEIGTAMSDKVRVVRINVDDNQKLVKELKVFDLPVLQLYKNKQVVWQHAEYIGKEEVLKQLQ